jgi:hypothetical protein
VNLARDLRFLGWLALCLPVGSRCWASKYYVDCSTTTSSSTGSLETPLRTLAEVNALSLMPGDEVLFKRGSICRGELLPRGSGTAAAPIRMNAYGEGGLPKIISSPGDPATFRLTDQQFWEIQSLDLGGSTTVGLLVEAGASTLHHLLFRDLLVHNVQGPLKHKESGLVVLHATSKLGSFDDVIVDGVQAYNTTQWSGIFIADARHVQVRNSIVHDVQGDGIVVFRSRDAVIARSLAWHTGMQHQQTIGTPNAIWTWRCIDCTVEDNEAFLADSPGVDGGAFDIDYGNLRNTVQRNFGHDTAGYCVSIFGAFEPTKSSVVADNLCLNNGLSPRLAQRQGAILLMTWQGGSIDDLVVRHNRVAWNPSGDTPAVQSGADLHVSGIVLMANEITSSGVNFIDPGLHYQGQHNLYAVATSQPSSLAAARARFLKLPEEGSTLRPATQVPTAYSNASESASWSLVATAPSLDSVYAVRGMLVQLLSAARQFSHAGLRVTLNGDAHVIALATDWNLPAAGVTLESRSEQVGGLSIKLVSPTGDIVSEWQNYPGPVDLGAALRDHVGAPNFAFLPFEEVRATD